MKLRIFHVIKCSQMQNLDLNSYKIFSPRSATNI